MTIYLTCESSLKKLKGGIIVLETVFVSYLEISATTSIIILALRLLAPYLNKTYAAKWKYWIWLILAVWLIIPASISLPTTPVEVNIPNAPIIPSDNVLPNVPSSDVVTVQPDATTIIQPKQILPEAQRTITLLDLIALIWLIGIVAFLIYQMAGYFIFKKKVLRWSRAPQDPRIESAIHSASSQIGLTKRVIPFISDIVSSPLMIGFFRPLLILPCETYSDADLSFIVRHELTHCRRNDLWYKLLLIIANAVHWYNPVIYLMFHEANGDLELSCDDAIINGMSFAERKVYTETILASIQRQGMRKTALSTYFYGGQRTMKNRFINILNTKRKKNGALVLLTVVLAVGIVGGLVGWTTANSEPNADATSDVLSLVEDFGKALKAVTLTAPQDIAAESIEEHYSEYITPELLAMWQSDPQNAPGRTLSSPWPDRIEVTDITPKNDGEYTVSGEIIEVTSNDLQNGGAAAKYPVTLIVTRQDDRWFISSVTISSEWQPQTEYENQDEYLRALDAALQSVNTEEIAVEDMGDNEKTARAWMVAWFDMYKALPRDNMAYITEGIVDSLQISQVSKEGLPKAFIFSVTFSVRPTYPIASNSFWAAGNTGSSPGRDETWGQMSREVELRQGDDGRYHFVSMGTGGAGDPDIYDMVDNVGATEEISGLFSYSVSDIEKIEFQNGNTGELVAYTNETEINDIIDHLNAFRYDQIEPANDGWTYAVRIWFKDGSDMQRIELRPSSACVDGNRYISSEYEYFPQEWLEQYWPS